MSAATSRFRPRFAGRLALATVLGMVAPPLPAAPSPDTLLRALEDELRRSEQELFIEGMDRPYFIAYTVKEVKERALHAADGALVTDQEQHWRTLQVTLRVGDYDFDNGNFSGGGAGGITLLPLEDDYQELRRRAWLATDAAYKSALAAIAGKRAALQNRIREDALPDFSRQAPFVNHDGQAPPRLQTENALALVLALSESLSAQPDLVRSDATFLAQAATTHYLNTEGAAFTRNDRFTALAVTAGAQAEDGRPVEDHVLAYASSPDGLPSREHLLEEVEAMAARVSALLEAPLLERYNGPVLFEGQAAAEAFSQGFTPALIARRAPVTGNGTGGPLPMGAEGPFQDRIGARVLPRFLGLVDDPTLSVIDGRNAPSGYIVDDEGVPAAPTLLVERGRLRTLLNDRTPTRDVQASTGNAFGGQVLPSNLVLSSDVSLDRAALEEELLALVEESGNDYGVIVTRLFNPSFPSGVVGSASLSLPLGGPTNNALAVEAYRVWPDGRRERVRNVQLLGLRPDPFRDIIAVGRERLVYTAPGSAGPVGFGPRGMLAGGAGFGIRQPAATVAVPALLFEELTLRTPEGDNPSLPVVPRPRIADRAAPR